MPVNSLHPDYEVMLPSWTRARDVLAGEDAVKAAGEKYLPRLEATSDPEYVGIARNGDQFEAQSTEQIRVLRLVRSGEVNSCHVERWQPEVLPHRHQRDRKKSDKTKWKLTETKISLRLGKPLPALPFVFTARNTRVRTWTSCRLAMSSQ